MIRSIPRWTRRTAGCRAPRPPERRRFNKQVRSSLRCEPRLKSLVSGSGRTYMMPDDQSRAEPSQSSRSASGARRSVPGRDRSDGNGEKPSPPGGGGVRVEPADGVDRSGWVIETVYSPFHCLYQDALFFHTQSRVARSDSEASRLARSALLLYVLSGSAGASSRRGTGASGVAGPDRRSQPADAAGRSLAALARHHGRARGAPGSVSARRPPLAAIRRAVHAPRLMVLSRTALGPTSLLPISSSRRRLRTDPTAPGSYPAPSHHAGRLLDFPAHRAASRPVCPPPSAPRHGAESSTPPSRPSTAGWVGRSRRATAIAASPFASSTPRRKPLALDAGPNVLPLRDHDFFGPSTRALRLSSGLATKFHRPSSFQGPRSSLPMPISPSPSRDRL